MTPPAVTADVHAAAMGAPPGMDRCPLMPTYAAPAVSIASGSGCWLTDIHGNRYLDLVGGLAVTALGHAHPVVTDALAVQAATLVHTSNLLANPLAAELAVSIDRLVGGGGQVFLANSGAEVNEAAIKLARRFGGEGRRVVVAADGSFHGRTLGALAATGQPAKRTPFEPLPAGFRHVPYGDLAALDAALGPDVAAVLIEAIQGEGGVVVPPAGYLAGVRERCDAHGALLMVDEVQTGMGRTGEWFAFQHDDIRPDVVTMAKALGNGVPVGACWARTEVANAFVPGDHGTTFGGQPLACAAALATIGELERLDAPTLAATTGAALAGALTAVPGVASVRGRGMLLAAELDAGLDAPGVAAAALRRGVIVNPVTPTALRLAPPLVLTNDELAHGVSTLGEVLAVAMADGGPPDTGSAP